MKKAAIQKWKKLGGTELISISPLTSFPKNIEKRSKKIFQYLSLKTDLPLTVIKDRLITKIKSGSFSVSINEYGAIKDLTVDGVQLIKDNGNNCLTFKSFGADDYEYWLKTIHGM